MKMYPAGNQNAPCPDIEEICSTVGVGDALTCGPATVLPSCPFGGDRDQSHARRGCDARSGRRGAVTASRHRLPDWLPVTATLAPNWHPLPAALRDGRRDPPAAHGARRVPARIVSRLPRPKRRSSPFQGAYPGVIGVRTGIGGHVEVVGKSRRWGTG
jgi:hypothetical protein